MIAREAKAEGIARSLIRGLGKSGRKIGDFEMQCACDTSDKENIYLCPTHTRIAELEAALRLCVGALDQWQGAAPLSEAQVQARAVLKKSS